MAGRDAEVRLTTEDPPVMVRVKGITPDGLLHTTVVGNEEQYFNLTPQDHTFDIEKGEIRACDPL
jgi:hypothetical protein